MAKAVQEDGVKFHSTALVTVGTIDGADYHQVNYLYNSAIPIALMPIHVQKLLEHEIIHNTGTLGEEDAIEER